MNWREDPEACSIAYDYLSSSVRPSMLTRECPHWVVAHHYLAKVILREPSLINSKSGVSMAVNGVAHIDSTVNHLSLALTSPVCQRYFHELHFDIGLAHLIRLYAVTDKLQVSTAVASAMSTKQNAETVRQVESHLLKALKGVSVASKGGLEAYLFFFASLKMAELRIIQAVYKSGLKASGPGAGAPEAQKAALLKSAAGFIVETLHARKCEENMDLNYLAIAQVCFLLSSSHRYYLAIRCYARAMMSISCMMNRLRFLPGVNGVVTKHADLSRGHEGGPVPTGSPEYSAMIPDDESTRITCFAISCCNKITEWQPMPPYKDGTKRNTATAKHSPLITIIKPTGTDATGAPQTSQVKRQWSFESNNIDVERIKPQAKGPDPDEPESSVGVVSSSTKGHKSLKKKSRLEEVVDAGAVEDPMESGGVLRERRVRREANFFSRAQSFFNTSRHHTENAILSSTNRAVGAPIDGASSMGSRFKRSMLPGKFVPAELISSEQAFYVLSMLSRLSRIRLLRTAFDLGASRGERARFVLCGLGNDGLARKRGVGIPAALFSELKRIQRRTMQACEQYPIPPGSIRDLSVRPQHDVNKIFKSQLTVTKLLSAEEACLFHEVARYDTFLPMITSTCTLTRGISRFDRHLFDQDTLLESDEESEESEESEEDDNSDDDEDNRIREEDSEDEAELAGLAETPSSVKGKNSKRYVTKGVQVHKAKAGHRLVNIPDQKLEDVRISNNRRVGRGKHGVDVDVGFLQQQRQREERERPRDDYRKREEHKDNNEVGVDGWEDDFDVEDVDKITPLLCNVLDGSLSSIREVLIEHLRLDDVMLLWHMSVPSLGGNHCLQLSVAWWDDAAANAPAFVNGVASGNSNSNSNSNSSIHANLMLESAHLEADTSRVAYLLQSLLDALNARSGALRQGMCMDAMRALSECFALGEVLQLLPQRVTNIVVCCPPALRLVPWHALTVNLPLYMIPAPVSAVELAREEGDASVLAPLNPIEEGEESETPASERGSKASQKAASDKYFARGPTPDEVRAESKRTCTGQHKTILLVEKYAVMLGPSLSMYELNCNKLRRVDHSGGNHKMCFVDGGSAVSLAKGSATECEAITKTWSGDPWDYTTLRGQDASVSNLTTTVDKKKREEHDLLHAPPAPQQSIFQRAFGPAKFEAKGRSAMISTRPKDQPAMGGIMYALSGFMGGGGGGGGTKAPWIGKSKGGDSDNSSDSSEGEEEGEAEAEEVLQAKAKAREYCDNSLTFLTCRVLHVCSSKVICPTPSSVPPRAGEAAGVHKAAPAGMKSHHNKNKRAFPALVFPMGVRDNRTMLTARCVLLPCIALYCIALYCIALPCLALPCIALCIALCIQLRNIIIS
jgi:hypothetical protein